ncbi:MAG: DMT family transporter [Cryomorphaceae bacterium]|nr:DMT family transporter [Flavobacteriales bacterium]
MSPRLLAHLALLIVALIYSANYVIAKDVMPEYIGPRGFIFIRVVGATLLFFAFSTFTKGSKRIERKDWFRILLCGFFGVAGNQLLFFEGLNLTTPINAAVIMTSNPVLVLVMGALLLRERLKPLKILGVIIGGGGALYLILGSGEANLLEPTASLGNLLIFINASSYAVYLVIVKPLMAKYDALLVIKWVFFSGLLFVVPAGVGQFSEIDWSSWTPGIFASVGFVVVFTTFIAYLFNVFALKTLSSATVSTYIYLQPLFTTLLSLFLARDVLTLRAVVAAALIFTGVYLAARKQQKK